MCYTYTKCVVQISICPSICCICKTLKKSTFHNHFIFGHKVYWDISGDTIETQHHNSLNMCIMTQFLTGGWWAYVVISDRSCWRWSPMEHSNTSVNSIITALCHSLGHPCYTAILPESMLTKCQFNGVKQTSAEFQLKFKHFHQRRFIQKCLQNGSHFVLVPMYRKTSNISRTLVCNKTVDDSDCSWSIACWRCSNYISILDLTPGFNGLDKDNCKTTRETVKFWDLVWLILQVLR